MRTSTGTVVMAASAPQPSRRALLRQASLRVVVTLSESPLQDTLNEILAGQFSPAEIIRAALNQMRRIQQEQRTFLASLQSQGISAQVIASDSFETNTLILEVSRANLAAIREMPQVKSVALVGPASAATPGIPSPGDRVPVPFITPGYPIKPHK